MPELPPDHLMLEVAVVVGRHGIDGRTQVVGVGVGSCGTQVGVGGGGGTGLEEACMACSPAHAGVVLKLGILRHTLGLSAACFHR